MNLSLAYTLYVLLIVGGSIAFHVLGYGVAGAWFTVVGITSIIVILVLMSPPPILKEETK